MVSTVKIAVTVVTKLLVNLSMVPVYAVQDTRGNSVMKFVNQDPMV